MLCFGSEYRCVLHYVCFAGAQIASLKDRLYGANIFNAINQGNIDKVKEILDEKPESIKQLGEEHRSPLHLAAFRGHTAIIELLLQRYTHTHFTAVLFSLLKLPLSKEMQTPTLLMIKTKLPSIWPARRIN